MRKRYRKKIKAKHGLVGRTKLLTIDKQGIMIGKVIEYEDDYRMILGIKHRKEGVELFTVKLAVWQNHHAFGNACLNKFSRSIRGKVKRWVKPTKRPSKSKYSTLFRYGTKHTKLRLNINNEDMKHFDLLSKRYKLQDMVVKLSSYRSYGKLTSYENYILTNDLGHELNTNTKYIFTK